jgi:hypothetical protein
VISAAIANSPFGHGWQGVGDVDGDGKADLVYWSTAAGQLTEAEISPFNLRIICAD